MSRPLTPETIGISDPDFASTNLYQHPLNRERLGSRIVYAGARDTGASNAIAPVLHGLADHRWNIYALANGPAEDILRNSNNGFRLRPYLRPNTRFEAMQADA